MEYNFKDIEKKWQARWAKEKTFAADNNSTKPKYYVLDMFPYPSGAGLHVGHPLGYIASDIYARFKRHKGFNVLHPMGYDSFGLPAEQYAIQTGQHPKITTEQNIARYREQLDKIGFSFDWDREVRTSSPDYYKWTQWIFIQLFNAWYNKNSDKTEKLDTLLKEFEADGNKNVNAVCAETELFSAGDWKNFSEKQRSDILMNYRIAYLSEARVNWCPAMGTVLANDEVKDGVSERGGYPVEQKLMKQWSMRITAYAQRLLSGLDTLDWPEPLKESQRYWIGKSEGTSLKFRIENSELGIEVFTTRPDTIFGVSFVTLAPEHELIDIIVTEKQKTEVAAYVTQAKNRSERERQADVKRVSGVFSGAYVMHPFTGKQIPIWIGDYVLAGYGTGAVMAVPGHDTRDYAFAKHFNLPIIEVVAGGDLSKEAYDAKEGKLINSDFLNGLEVKAAIKKAIEEIEKKNLGKGKINFRLRDAVFGRQRYWGEPIPIYYKNGIPYAMPENELPLILPEVDKYLPTETGEPPLARATNWKYKDEFEYEKTTMPGWAGSSWYFLRYMDAHNDKEFASKKLADYWKEIDLYIGGSEHATGHLLYVRFWTKALKDLGYINIEEPAKKLINQGMIQGESAIFYRLNNIITAIKIGEPSDSETEASSNALHELRNRPVLISATRYEKLFKKNEWNKLYDGDEEIKALQEETQKQLIKKDKNYTGNFQFTAVSRINVNINIVTGGVLDKDRLKKWRSEYENAYFLNEENGDFLCKYEVEKMSKSKHNVVTPDGYYDKELDLQIPGVIDSYGADNLRLYEMFLGPLELSKPWSTNGITGVAGFLKKLWRLFSPSPGGEGRGEVALSNETPTKAELKALHKSIKKITEDIERFSFNTSVSNFMILVNELTEIKCNKRQILEPLLIILSPYAPHIAEELWEKLGHKESITFAPFPMFNEAYLVEDNFSYPISFNGKMRFNMDLPLALTPKEVEKIVLEAEQTHKFLEGKTPRKVIVVPNKIVNIVV